MAVQIERATQGSEESQRTRSFNPNEHLMQLKSRDGNKDYLPVQYRLDEVYGQPDLVSERSQIAQASLRVDGNPYALKYVERFLQRVEVDSNGCWRWASTLNNKGYARMGMYHRLVLMHRWAYILFRGVILPGLELDHLCSTPCCVNPDHLDPVTHKENNQRGNSISTKHAQKTHCPQGHPYDEENTSYTRGKGRACKTCRREKSRPYHKIIAARLTHCPQGHPYDAENTGIRKSGSRYCKTCSKVHTPTFYMRRAKELAS